MTSESTRFLGQPSETKPTVGRLGVLEIGSRGRRVSRVGDRLTVLILAGLVQLIDVLRGGFEGVERGVGGGLGGGVAGDDDAVGFEVGDAVVGGVAEQDGLAEHLEVAAGVVVEVAADGSS